MATRESDDLTLIIDVARADANLSGRGSHAALWRHKKITDLGTLGGISRSAAAINESGEVVGTADTAGGQVHAFFWAHDSIPTSIRSSEP